MFFIQVIDIKILPLKDYDEELRYPIKYLSQIVDAKTNKQTNKKHSTIIELPAVTESIHMPHGTCHMPHAMGTMEKQRNEEPTV